ncbi:VTT domain-containing protein [Roseiarcaceae bacterium H3SJ34-1]|uniref:TVP38/TMEM64 family protein n=1 Tax=Terripilifer ovatus TaxID=3032367 RepID=UPI003AB99746|nr:VTT domain-containing protein [Roseiarcaceae bacterium H3SJ34-1]
MLLFIVLGGLIASGATRFLSLESLVESRDWLAEQVAQRTFLSVAAFFAVYAAAALSGIPGGALFSIAGGFLFGALAGTAISLAAILLGGSIFFLIVRTSLGSVLMRRGGRWALQLRDGFHKNAVSYLLFLRLTPAFPFFLVNTAMAMAELKLRTFIWVTAVGLLPVTLAYSLAGAGLDSVMVAQRRAYTACVSAGASDCRMHIDLRHLVTSEMLLALSALGVLALLPVLIRWKVRVRPIAADRQS